MEKSILDLNEAYSFHEWEVLSEADKSYDALTYEQQDEFDDDVPIQYIIDPQTVSNHLAMMSWIMGLVAQKHTTSYTFYANKCKELSIPPYTQE